MKPRPIRIDGNDAIITLTQGFEAVIDADDVHLVKRYNWHLAEKYAATNVNGMQEKRYLQRMLMSPPAGMMIDHIDGNPLNNRRSNLRLATLSQSNRNRRLHSNNAAGLKGVTKHQSGKWRSQIRVNGINHHLGLHATPEAAHAAYVEAAKRLHGEFYRAN